MLKTLTNNTLKTIIEELKKEENKKKISEQIINPFLSEIFVTIYPYLIAIFILYVVILILIFIIIYLVFKRT